MMNDDFVNFVKKCQTLELVILRHELKNNKKDAWHLSIVDKELKDRSKKK